MVDYRNIADIELEQGRIAASQTAFAFRDNPLAIGRGAPGAPRISPWAMAEPVVAGDVGRFRVGQTFANGSATNVVVAVASVANSGTLRIKFSHRRAGSGSNVHAQIDRIRAGDYSTLVSWTIGGTWTARAYDTTLEPGDTFFWLHRRGADVDTTSEINGIELATDGGVLFPLAPYFSFGTAPA